MQLKLLSDKLQVIRDNAVIEIPIPLRVAKDINGLTEEEFIAIEELEKEVGRTLIHDDMFYQFLLAVRKFLSNLKDAND